MIKGDERDGVSTDVRNTNVVGTSADDEDAENLKEADETGEHGGRGPLNNDDSECNASYFGIRCVFGAAMLSQL